MGASTAFETPDRFTRATASQTAVKVLIVCPVRLYCDGIANRLRREPGLNVVGAISDPHAAVAHLEACGAAMVLLDAGLSRHGDLVRRMIEAAAGTTVLALALDEEETSVLGCAEAGIVGYIPPRASLDELVSAVRGAVHGEMKCPPRIAGFLVRRLAALAAERRGHGRLDALTDREREVLALLGDRLSNKAIARRLGIEIATVKNHVHHVLEKLGVSSREGAATRARALLHRPPNRRT
jgi:two-component system, NarL family, nitrate/nitrite response regulator NarL